MLLCLARQVSLVPSGSCCCQICVGLGGNSRWFRCGLQPLQYFCSVESLTDLSRVIITSGWVYGKVNLIGIPNPFAHGWCTQICSVWIRDHFNLLFSYCKFQGGKKKNKIRKKLAGCNRYPLSLRLWTFSCIEEFFNLVAAIIMLFVGIKANISAAHKGLWMPMHWHTESHLWTVMVIQEYMVVTWPVIMDEIRNCKWKWAYVLRVK